MKDLVSHVIIYVRDFYHLKELFLKDATAMEFQLLHFVKRGWELWELVTQDKEKCPLSLSTDVRLKYMSFSPGQMSLFVIYRCPYY